MKRFQNNRKNTNIRILTIIILYYNVNMGIHNNHNHILY